MFSFQEYNTFTFFVTNLYGLFSTRKRKQKIKRCQEILAVCVKELEVPEPESWQNWLFELTGVDLRICTKCGKGRMVRSEVIRPLRHAPPQRVSVAALIFDLRCLCRVIG